MQRAVTRRRFLSVTAAAAAVAALPARAAQVVSWRGAALGASASMTLTGLSRSQAEPVFRAVEQELARLERIFSLFQESSEVARLNRTGRLRAPSADLLAVLDVSDHLHRATGGAFDPTIQPVWQALAKGTDVAPARVAVGWRHLEYGSAGVHLKRPGMAITLNGIAQGFISDKIAELLRQRGLDDLVIDMGEIVALGTRPDDTNWTAGIATSDGSVVRRVALRDRAIATSSPLGTTIGAARDIGHIVDPKHPATPPANTLVSISAPTAVVADGLSTACCIMDPASAKDAVAQIEGARIEWIS